MFEHDVGVPAGIVVTAGAIFALLTVVRIIDAVTGIALRIRLCHGYGSLMAELARNLAVAEMQFEAGFHAVIEDALAPVF